MMTHLAAQHGAPAYVGAEALSQVGVSDSWATGIAGGVWVPKELRDERK